MDLWNQMVGDMKLPKMGADYERPFLDWLLLDGEGCVCSSGEDFVEDDSWKDRLE